jgi:hypothetical protein
MADFQQSVRLLKEADSAIQANEALAADIEVVKIHRQGSDWILRDFDPRSFPLRDAIGSDAIAQAAHSRVINILRANEGRNSSVLNKILEKIQRRKPSENLHWSPEKRKILIIDMQ